MKLAKVLPDLGYRRNAFGEGRALVKDIGSSRHYRKREVVPMTIREIEERSGMTRANIRFYEQEGLLSPVRRENGYRD